MTEETLAELERLLTEMLAWAEARGEELYQLHAEVARLRGVLEEIACGPCCQTPGCDEDDPYCDAMIARSALSTPADKWLERHDAEVRREERERCIAKCAEVEDQYCPQNNGAIAARECAAAIREQEAGHHVES